MNAEDFFQFDTVRMLYNPQHAFLLMLFFLRAHRQHGKLAVPSEPKHGENPRYTTSPPRFPTEVALHHTHCSCVLTFPMTREFGSAPRARHRILSRSRRPRLPVRRRSSFAFERIFQHLRICYLGSENNFSCVFISYDRNENRTRFTSTRARPGPTFEGHPRLLTFVRR